ncbi:structural maintenance of chromosomes protein 5 isoform X2 [Colletes gigas]|uniref:structural maintenance of chromosomes protein 5 isoform X2 n=1 Tax=Colletes gigas TaxID=935657 RepID=UPI001C9BB725|nr:structural maintenance of chromosomes protein 5 isoform X2 [Colletes gigas]
MSNSSIEKGIITYIYLANFVTYNEVVIKPGRYLNVIIGPNGTGKSTIVCAIVLGLGGKLSTIGRATQIADYVKAGCEEATITIHLKNDGNKDIVITRKFNIQGKSSWLLNQKQSTIKEIQDLTKTFDIQIDNLCQFLPQDKVQDFSKMNAQELLENTERSVGDPMIIEHHKQLIQYRSEHKDLEVQIAQKQKLLASKTQIYEGMKESVSSIKERKLIKKKIVRLKQKKAWILYDHKRKELLQLKQEKETAAAEMTSLETEMKPTCDLIEKTKSEIKVLQNSVTDNNNKINMKVAKHKKLLDDILDCENNIRDCGNKCKQRIQIEETRNHDIDVAKLQKYKLDNDLSLMLKDIGSEETLKKQQQETVSKIEEQRGIINMLTSKNVALKQEEERIHFEIRGTTLVDNNMDRIPSTIRCYFSKTNNYSVSTSKYTGQKSISMQQVFSTRMLSIVLDQSKLLKIDEKIKLLRERKSSVFKNIEQIEEQICGQNKELDKHRANKNKVHQDLQQIQLLKSRISMVQQKLINLENERTSIEQIKESYTNEIKVILNKQLDVYEKYNVELEECSKYITTNQQVELALKLQNRFLRLKVHESQDLREKFKAAEDTIKRLNSEMQSMKNEVQRMYADALETTNGISPKEKAFAPINKVFNKLPPTLEDINKELNIAQAKVFCMGHDTDGENILHEYEKVETEIRNLKDFVQKKIQDVETTTQQMEALQEEWLKPLLNIIKKINSNFSTYFAAMGCAGEVTLAQAENTMDFDQYGIKIRVKFRDTDQLQELTRHHQSGGERAVTTAIYMISLQELSRVPFRCVDEINQGMDAANERRIFNLLVQMTGRRNSSQYFLLTPKLVPDLEYSETVTVHCVFNGPFMVNHTEFDMNEYCKHLMERMGRENVDDD